MSSTSENNDDTDTNKQDANNNKFDQFMTMGVDLWHTAAMSWIATYNEFVKNALTMSEYWLNLFSSPSSRIEEKKDKVKLE
jgi:FtsH-binding integral membrane protein